MKCYRAVLKRTMKFMNKVRQLSEKSGATLLTYNIIIFFGRSTHGVRQQPHVQKYNRMDHHILSLQILAHRVFSTTLSR